MPEKEPAGGEPAEVGKRVTPTEASGTAPAVFVRDLEDLSSSGRREVTMNPDDYARLRAIVGESELLRMVEEGRIQVGPDGRVISVIFSKGIEEFAILEDETKLIAEDFFALKALEDQHITKLAIGTLIANKRIKIDATGHVAWLDLSGTYVSDLSPLAKLSALRFFYAERCPFLTDVQPLASSLLEVLDLEGTLLNTLTGIELMQNLKALFLYCENSFLEENDVRRVTQELASLETLVLPRGKYLKRNYPWEDYNLETWLSTIPEAVSDPHFLVERLPRVETSSPIPLDRIRATPPPPAAASQIPPPLGSISATPAPHARPLSRQRWKTWRSILFALGATAASAAAVLMTSSEIRHDLLRFMESRHEARTSFPPPPSLPSVKSIPEQLSPPELPQSAVPVFSQPSETPREPSIPSLVPTQPEETPRSPIAQTIPDERQENVPGTIKDNFTINWNPDGTIRRITCDSCRASEIWLEKGRGNECTLCILRRGRKYSINLDLEWPEPGEGRSPERLQGILLSLVEEE